MQVSLLPVGIKERKDSLSSSSKRWVQVAVPGPSADLNQQAGACQPAKAFSGERMVLKCAV